MFSVRTPIVAANLLTARQVAEQLAVSQRFVYDLAARGDLPSVRMGAVLRFDQADVEAFVEASKVPAAVKPSAANAGRPATVRLNASEPDQLACFRRAGVKPRLEKPTRGNVR